MESLCSTGFGKQEIMDKEAKTSKECLDNSQLKNVAYGFYDLWDDLTVEHPNAEPDHLFQLECLECD